MAFLGELSRHQGAVNCVRFSPDGKTLASAGDDKSIVLWQHESEAVQSNVNEVSAAGGNTPNKFVAESVEEDAERWRAMAMLRGHREMIYDLAWSPDSQNLISGSVDNTAILWDVARASVLETIDDHQHFVQGVAWHPLGGIVATQSSDRSLCIFDVAEKAGKGGKLPQVGLNLSHTVFKSELPMAPPAPGADTETTKLPNSVERLFVDETRTPFFRRLCFTPDGALLLAPAGRMTGAAGEELNTLYLFRTASPGVPVGRLAGCESTVVAARCCPVLFKRRNQDEGHFAGLEHRSVFAVATEETVLIYDTELLCPFAQVANIHFARISDLAWSADGRALVVGSEDGYCSVVSFKEDELGIAVPATTPLVTQSRSLASNVIETVSPVNAFPIDTEPRKINPKETVSTQADKTSRAAPPRRVTPTVVAMTVASEPVSAANNEAPAAPPASKVRRINPELIEKSATDSPAATATPRRIIPTLIQGSN